MEIFITLLYIVFVLSAIVLVVVILLQEGKGGGLTDALGTAGQATFGVGASGINRFTGGAVAVFLVSAMGIHMLNRERNARSVVGFSTGGPSVTAPVVPADGGTPTSDGAGGTPPSNPGGGTPPSNGGDTAPPGGGSTPPSGGSTEQPPK